MKVTDLSHKFNINDEVFPGTKKMNFYRTQTVEKDTYNLSMATINSHAGTHTDAPLHFVGDGKSLGEVDINKYVGRCFVVDCTDKGADSMIELNDVKQYESRIKDCKRVIFATGWNKHFNTDEFFTRYPSVSNDVARWLVDLGVEMMGVEGPSINTQTGQETHLILLENEVAIVEALTNLEGLLNKEIIFCGAPLSFEEMDGFPIKAYAIEM